MKKKNFIEQRRIDEIAEWSTAYSGLGVSVTCALENPVSGHVFKKLRVKCIEKGELFKLKKLITAQGKGLTEKEAEMLLDIYEKDAAIDEIKNFLELPAKALKRIAKLKKEQAGMRVRTIT